MSGYYFETDRVDQEADILQVLDGNEYFDDATRLPIIMTSLGTLILLEKSMCRLSPYNQNEDENDISLQRLSLAHERLHSMPKILLEQFATTVKILDISHNEFDKLDFLEEFSELTSLIADHNDITCESYLPFLPKLELLWVNHCKILDLYRWTYRLSSACPKLKYLSLMGNPNSPLLLNSRNQNERIRYRLFVLSLFPNLVHLDDMPVTEGERQRSRKLYQKHILDIVANKVQQNLPDYLRKFTFKMSLMISNENLSNTPEKNFIV